MAYPTFTALRNALLISYRNCNHCNFELFSMVWFGKYWF